MLKSDAPIGVEEFAKVIGVTRRTVSELVRRGVLRKRGRGFALSEAVQDYVRSIAAKHATTPGVETGAEARARLARLRADIAEAAYKRERGDLVDGKAILADVEAQMKTYFREVRRIPWVIANTLTSVDRELAMLIGRELQRCQSNIGYGRAAEVDGAGTDYDEIAEHSLMRRQGQGVLSADGERIAREARARRAKGDGPLQGEA